MGMVECPQCGRVAALEPDVQPFCRQCDSPLFWQLPRPPGGAAGGAGERMAVTSDPPRMLLGCPHCGYRSRVGREFCEACGTPLQPGPVRQRRQWLAPVAEEDEATRTRRIVVQIVVLLIALLLMAGVVLAIWLVFFRSSPWQTSTLDIGNASWDISATLLDGRPMIAYVDSGNQAVRMLACANTTCETRQSSEIATSLGGSGQGHGTAIAITEAGLPVIAFRAGETSALTVVACADLACADATSSQVDPPPDAAGDEARDAGYDPSITIGADGLPLISYWDRARRALMAAHCADPSCRAASTSRLTPAPEATDEDVPVGGDTAVAVGVSTPMIAFRNENPTRLDLLSCADSACTTGKIVTLVPRVDQPNSTNLLPGYENSIVTDAQGFAIVAYHDRSDDGIYVVRCLDEACTDVVRNEIVTTDDAFHSEPSIALLNGNPVVAFRSTPRGDESGRRVLSIVRCGDVSCSRKSEPEVVDGGPPGRLERAWTVLSRQPPQLVGRVGYSPSVRVTPGRRIVIAYGDATTGALKLAVSR